ncbi:ParB/RepB/Spo0J family partition protein [Loktanella sp. S4079]|uniref:ParB/RepB/Spo0J family partition protein n=1 Tax=Loktanella sp. S4079 TaxID=579483 RepID=UPI0005FA8138|nr:ParB/RepB/Spo0J family partition protein [Loktanella sp. S4079]KJZ19410.1 chromosome partitioning protein ParB [Loktanella sp. S4079]
MANNPKKSRGLGRGLSALMSDVTPDETGTDAPRRPDLMVPVEHVVPNPDQPRRTFAEEALQELASSIAEKGIIQPLIVRKSPSNSDNYEIVAGERRWRAAQIAKLHEIPVLLREYTDTEVLEVAIIENIQRADLNAVDEATGYRQLMDRFGHTQEQLATALGKSRSHIANFLRLLNLPNEVLDYLVQGQISAGHARALVGHDRAVEIAREIIHRNLSVRETEKLAKQGGAAKPKTKSAPKLKKDADTIQIEKELSATLRMKVSIDHKDGDEGGKMTIGYKSLDELDDLLRALSGG